MIARRGSRRGHPPEPTPRMYAHLWGTPELRGGLRGAGPAAELAGHPRRPGRSPGAPRASSPARPPPRSARTRAPSRLDLDLVAEQTRRTSHSMLGLIRALQQLLPGGGARARLRRAPPCRTSPTRGSRWSCARSGALVWRDLRAIEESLLELAVAAPRHGDGRPDPRAARRADHVRLQGRLLGRRGAPPPRPAARRQVPMAGRTARRCGRRPRVLRARRAWRSGREFCAELGLGDPGISWLTSRDRVAEFGGVLAMVCGTLARIGNEVYELQRPEIGELREPTTPEARSAASPCRTSATPRAASTWTPLARLVRANAGVLAEGMVVSHERDGRGWKAEWVALPEVCLLDRCRARGGPPAALRPRGRRRGDAGQPGAPRRPAGLRAGARRADRTAGQARGPAADARGAQPRDTRRASRRGRARRRRRGHRAGVPQLAWPGRRSAPPARWSTPSSPVRARARADGAGHMDRDPPAHQARDAAHAAGAGAASGARARSAGPIYVKRDDLTGFGVAGNKARALEFLRRRDAVGRGSDVLRRRRQSQLELLRGRGDGRLHRRAGRVTSCSAALRPRPGR